MSEAMELAYEERGSGKPLIFVHGFPLDRRMWIDQLAGLAKKRRCLAVDLRGHGLSKLEDPEPSYTMDDLADDLAKTMDELGVEKADLCGLSMGGYVLFAFNRRYPDRVSSLILCDTKSEADTPEGKQGRENTAKSVRENGMAALYDGLGPKLLASNPGEDTVERLRQMFLEMSPAVAAADALAMRDRPDSTPDLAGIKVPVLWIHGEEDQLMPIDGARATAENIPGAKFVAIPRGGHMAPMENPAAANSAIAGFLS